MYFAQLLSLYICFGLSVQQSRNQKYSVYCHMRQRKAANLHNSETGIGELVTETMIIRSKTREYGRLSSSNIWSL